MDQLNRITDKMLVQRSEHNDGSLQDLEEIALHQQQLGSIEYINRKGANQGRLEVTWKRPQKF